MIGKGNFAATWQADLITGGGPVPVAVKVPKDSRALEEYRREMTMLMTAGEQANVMKFLGLLATKMGSQCFILEFCEQGSLDNLHNKFDLTEESRLTKIVTGERL